MCVNPLLINGRNVGCRTCKQCRSNYVTDWVGRCIAENRYATKTHVITLTYGRDKVYRESDHANAGILNYDDCQKMFKALRDAGYPLRFFAVGEYGTKKARSHWHVIIFWQAGVPPIEAMRKRIEWKWWPHGVAYFDDLSVKAVTYACKYILKDTGDAVGSNKAQKSTMPPLGYEYFRDLAHLHVRNWLAPQDLFYTFPESIGRDGTRNRYMMHRATARYFLKCFLEEWRRVHPGESTPWSDLLERYKDTLLHDKVSFEPPAKDWLPKPPKPTQEQIDLLPGGWNMRTDYSEKHRAFYVTSKWGGLVRWWTFNEEGKRAWMPVIRSANGNELNEEQQTQSVRGYAKTYAAKSGRR